jgi:Fur family ferric uptake transcriptional regulator
MSATTASRLKICPSLITNVYGALAGLGAGRPAVEPLPEPAVSIRSSVKPDYIVCLEDGKKLKMLKRHLMTHYNMTPDQYRARWNLPADYPMVAPNYAESAANWRRRSALAASPARSAAATHRGLTPNRKPRRLLVSPRRSRQTGAAFRFFGTGYIPVHQAIDIEALCAERGLRITEQRRVIARVLSESPTTPTSKAARTRVGDRPGISIATVYRTVRLFEEAGILDRHDFGDGRARYEAAPEAHHDHMIDVETGKVIEFVDPELEALQRQIAERLGFRLVDHRMELRGGAWQGQCLAYLCPARHIRVESALPRTVRSRASSWAQSDRCRRPGADRTSARSCIGQAAAAVRA